MKGVTRWLTRNRLGHVAKQSQPISLIISRKAWLTRGGGTANVTKIKIATAQGGGSAIYNETFAYQWSGGFFLKDKTIGDLVGDKTIIDFVFSGKDATGSAFPFIGQMFNANLGNYLALDDTTLKSQNGGDVSGFARANDDITQPITVDIYAICI